MINSQTAKLLRRWIVAGLAAALALAWTITTLVAPSQASSDQNLTVKSVDGNPTSLNVQYPDSENAGRFPYSNDYSANQTWYNQNREIWNQWNQRAKEIYGGSAETPVQYRYMTLEEPFRDAQGQWRYKWVDPLGYFLPNAGPGKNQVITDTACIDPNVGQSPVYTTYVKNLPANAVQAKITLDPQKAIEFRSKTGKNYSPEQQGMFKALAYVNNGGDPRLNDFVNYDEATLKQKIAEYPAIGDFYNANMNLIEAQRDAVSKMKSLKPNQKFQVLQGIAWAINRGNPEWLAIGDNCAYIDQYQTANCRVNKQLTDLAQSVYADLKVMANSQLKMYEAYAKYKEQFKRNEEAYKKALEKWQKETKRQVEANEKLYQTNKQLLESIKIYVDKTDDGKKLAIKLHGSSEALALLQKSNARIDVNLTVNGRTVPVSGVSVAAAASPNGIPVPVESTGLGCDQSLRGTVEASFKGEIEISGTYIFDGRNLLQRQIVLQKYKVYVSGNTSHDFNFTGDCPVTPEPKIGTTLVGPGEAKQIDTADLEDSNIVTLTDKVQFKNLKGGQNYVIKGELVDGDGNSVNVTGVSPAFDPKFSPGATDNGNGYYSGTVNMTFQVPVEKIRKHEKLVAYETLYKGTTPQSGNEFTAHKDKDDANQTVTEKPRLKTTAKVNGESLNGGKIARPAEGADVTITDTVVWHKLQPGTYTLSGKLMKKVGDQVSEVPGSATQKNFSISGGKTGTVTMDLKLPAKEIEPGASYVVYEKVYKGENNTSGEPIAKHEDQNDGGQTISVSPKEHKLPSIETKAWVRDDGNSLISAVEADGNDFKVKDQITYKDLKPGTYTAFATLVNKDYPKDIIASGRQVFTNGAEDGSTLVELAVAGSKVKADGKYVVFERIYQGKQTSEPSGEPYAKHQEINDQSQTITVAPKKAVPAEFKIVKKTVGDNANTDRVFDFDVSCDGFKTTATVLVRKGTSQGETTVSNKALTSGMSCQVSERTVQDDLNTVKVKFSGTDTNPEGTLAKFDLTEGNAKTVVVTATNTFTPKEAKFTVRKNVEAAGVTHFTVPNSFNFSYMCDGDAHWKDLPTLAAGQTSQVISVQPGVQCQVKENTATPQNLNHVLKWDGVDSQAGGIATFRTDASNIVALVATNTYTEKTGQLEISKQVVDQTAGQGNIPGTFEMKYLCATGQRADSVTVPLTSVSVNKNSTATITGIPVGSWCAVAEDTTGINVRNTTLTTTFDGQAPKMVTIGGHTLHNAALSNPIKAGESQKATIKVENKYVNEKVGGFEVEKQVSGVVSPETVLKDVAFDFGYSCTVPGSSYPVKGNFKLKHGEKFSSADRSTPQLNNLPVGTECKIWEETPKSVENADYAGSGIQVEGNEGVEATASKEKPEVTIKLKTSAAKAKIKAVNEYTQKLGAFTLKKVVKGNADPAQNISAYRFQLTYKDGNNTHVEEVTLFPGASKSYWGLPLGSQVQVEELGAIDASGKFIPVNELSTAKVKHSIGWNGSLNDSSTAAANTFKITKPMTQAQWEANGKQGNVVVTATNSYQQIEQKGTFSVQKTSVKVAGETADKVTTPTSYNFTYNCTDGTHGNIPNVKPGGDPVVAPAQFRAGTVCTVTEQQVLPKGTNAQTVSWTVDGKGAGVGPASGQSVIITIGADVKTPVAVQAANEYQTPDKPRIATELKGEGRNGNVDLVAGANKTYTLTDKISYWNLQVGKTYKFSGELVMPNADKTAVTRTGIKAEQEVTITTASGIVELPFTLTQADVAKYSTLVAFEQLDLKVDGGYEPVTKHEDPKDKNQTKQVNPWIATVLTDTNGNKQINTAGKADSDLVTLVDTVKYHNLEAGKTYHLTGKLVDGAGNPIGVSPTSQAFTVPGTAGTLQSGEARMTFNVTVAQIRNNSKLVAFEYLHPGQPNTPGDGTVITKHEDPKDENQTVNEGPRAATTATNSIGTKVFDAKTPAKVLDRVQWAKLPAGNYVLVGTLMDKSTKQAVPNVHAQVVKFSVASGELQGTQEMTFEVPADQVKSNSQFVAFEKIYRQGDVDGDGNVKDGKTSVVEHSDINDEAQTVSVGEEPQSPVEPKLTLEKVVKSEGLEVPSTKEFAFTLKCSSPIDGRSQQKTFKVNAGSPIRLPYVQGANCTLTEDRAAAKVAGITPSQVAFSTNSSKIGLATSENTATFSMPKEELTEVNVVFTATNTYPAPAKPMVATSAKDANGTKGMYGQSKQANQVYAGTSATIVDEVSWANLLPGDYVVIGKLMDKETRKAVTSYTSAPLPFTVKEGEKNGKLDNKFTVSGESLKSGNHYVVYEYVYRAGDVNGVTPNNGATPVVEHAVITDADQTVEAITPPPAPAAKVKIMKKVVDSGMEVPDNRAYYFTVNCHDKDGKAQSNTTLKVRPNAATEITGLRSGYVCSINEDLRNAIEQQVTPSVSLTSGTPGFTVQQDSTAGAAHFTVPAVTDQVPEVLVNVTNTYNKMGKPELQTRAVTDNGTSSVQAGTATTVTDTVTWKNLPVGKYLLTGTLMHITDNNAVPTAGVTNEPVVLEINKDNSLAGSTTMKFNVPAGAISQAGKYVVYEYLYNYEDTDGIKPKPNTSTVVSHNDPSDDAQTVSVTEPPSVSTTATTDGANEKEIQKGKAAVITDTVNWKNLPAGNYQALSELVDTKGNPVTGATTMAVPFTVINGETAGSLTTKIQVPATATSSAGAQFVVFERIYRATDVDSQTGHPAQYAKPVVSELDLNAINQTVRVVETPKGPPVITFTKVTEKVLDGQLPDKDRKFKFTISCDKDFGGTFTFEIPAGVSAGLPADKQLQVGTVCTLTEMLNDEANPDGILPDTINFTSSNPEMAVSKVNNQTAQFTVPDVDTKEVPEIRVTIKNIYSKDFPELGTVARDNADQDKVVNVKKGEPAQVQDVATWKNLAPGKYTMIGNLMDKLTGKPVVGANTPAVDFEVKKGEKTGTINALFTVPAENISTNSSWVVFEHVYKASDVKDGKVVGKATPVVEHANFEDADQTVRVVTPPASPEEKNPEIATVAKNRTTFKDNTQDVNFGKKLLTPGQDAVVEDTVQWKDLEPGEYTITGTLMDKETSAPLTYLDKDGKQQDGAKAERGSFHVAEGQTSGEAKVYFTVKGEAIQANRQYVVFEDLYKTTDIKDGQPSPGAKKVAFHRDINDVAQTVSGDNPTPGTPPETPKTPNTPGTPPPTPVTPPEFPKVVRTILAKTGSTTGIMAMTGVLVMVAGIGLVVIRRYQRDELED